VYFRFFIVRVGTTHFSTNCAELQSQLCSNYSHNCAAITVTTVQSHSHNCAAITVTTVQSHSHYCAEPQSQSHSHNCAATTLCSTIIANSADSLCSNCSALTLLLHIQSLTLQVPFGGGPEASKFAKPTAETTTVTVLLSTVGLLVLLELFVLLVFLELLGL
jgi:hypothetical protein